jgi:hypothetical protein
MGMMFGFGEHRRQLLRQELTRIAGELPALGARGTILINDVLVAGTASVDAELELLVVLDSDEPFHRRADFLTSHLRPRVGTRFLVYTPSEIDRLRESDRVLRGALSRGQVLDEIR